MAKFGANLPAILNPVGDTCVQVFIPNHPDYIKLFVRAVRMLEVNRMYARDETMEGAKIVTAQWRDRTITPLIEALANSTGSCGVDGECLAYPPFASFISYYPQNPYTEPELIPDGFEQPPFFVNGKDNTHDLPNYLKGDVLLDFGSINVELSWDLEKTPRIELCLTGSGVIEIHLLKIVQGGAAIISIDNPVDLGDIISGIIGEGIEIIQLNQDITSLPPETAEEVIIELDIATEGDHVVYIYYLPVINDSFIPLGFGGGLREISLCGNLRPCGTQPPPPPPPLEGVTELKSEFQFTAECGLEYRYRDQDDNIIGDWIPVAGWVDNAGLCFGGGGVSIDYEAMEAAMCAAIECGAEKIASRYLSGVAGNVKGGVTINPDGSIVIKPDGSVDDPDTEIDEAAASYMGGAIAVRQALKLFFDKIDNFYGPNNNAPVNNADFTKFQIKTYFPCDPVMDIAIDDYYAYRVTNGRHVFTPTATFDQYLFCKGVNEQSFARWLLDVSGYPIAKQTQMHLLVTGLADKFFTDYFDIGSKILTSAYLDAPCVPMPYQEFLNVPFGSARTLLPSPAKAAHRLKIRVEGYYTDPDLDLQDAFWYRTSGGVLTRSNFGFTHGPGNNMPSDNQVPYNPSHIYEYTIDLSNVNSNWSVQFNRNAGMNVSSTSPTNGFSITITDLGEYAV